MCNLWTKGEKELFLQVMEYGQRRGAAATDECERRHVERVTARFRTLSHDAFPARPVLATLNKMQNMTFTFNSENNCENASILKGGSTSRGVARETDSNSARQGRPRFPARRIQASLVDLKSEILVSLDVVVTQRVATKQRWLTDEQRQAKPMPVGG